MPTSNTKASRQSRPRPLLNETHGIHRSPAPARAAADIGGVAGSIACPVEHGAGARVDVAVAAGVRHHAAAAAAPVGGRRRPAGAAICLCVESITQLERHRGIGAAGLSHRLAGGCLSARRAGCATLCRHGVDRVCGGRQSLAAATWLAAGIGGTGHGGNGVGGD